MARKNLLTGLTDAKLTAVNISTDPAAGPVKASLAFTARGAVGSVSRSIDELAARADLAKSLEARLTAGSVIVDLDPAAIDGSFVVDRMQEEGESFRLLIEAIRANGQEFPILVRPHPREPGRYQVAFGHRRLRAAAELGRPVRASVKQLSDRDLVIAQGQENSARADLSFIERARFAHRLEAAGYDRETIMAALSVDKTTVSRMISVASRIPANIIDAVGAAPGVGRDRWIELAGLSQTPELPRAFAHLHENPEFLAAASDQRFDLLHGYLTALAAPPDAPDQAARRATADGRTTFWVRKDGAKIVKITANDKAFVLAIDRRIAPGFGDYLLGQLDRLYGDYANAGAQNGKGEGG